MIASVSILVEQETSVAAVNELLHCYRGAVLGRMGLPLPQHGMAVISLVLDATPDEVNRLAGKLGALPGVSAKALTARRKGGSAQETI